MSQTEDEKQYLQEVRRIAREFDETPPDDELEQAIHDSDWSSDWRRVLVVLAYSPSVSDLDDLLELNEAQGPVDAVCLCAARCLAQDVRNEFN